MISARPSDSPSSVANCSKTRTGSSVLRTVTALARRIRLVRVAAPASATAGEETAKSGRWCSPTPKTSSPTASASSISSTSSRSRRPAPAGPPARSAKLVTPISILDSLGPVGAVARSQRLRGVERRADDDLDRAVAGAQLVVRVGARELLGEAEEAAALGALGEHAGAVAAAATARLEPHLGIR